MKNHQRVIRITVSERNMRTIDKKDLQNFLLSHPNINREYVVVLNTYTNITRRTMLKLIHNLSNRVNRRFCKYFKKRPNRRIKFYSFPQRVFNNTHSHILLDIPHCYNPMKVKQEIESTFKKLGELNQTIYKVHFEDSFCEFSNAIYSSREYHSYDGENLRFDLI